jgi:WD40 repeat protein
VIRIYDENEDYKNIFRGEDTIVAPIYSAGVGIKRFTEVSTVKSQPQTVNPFENILLGTDSGALQVHFSHHPLLGMAPFSSLHLHTGELIKILVSPDGKYVFSAGSDGSIFVLQLTDLLCEPTPGARP